MLVSIFYNMLLMEEKKGSAFLFFLRYSEIFSSPEQVSVRMSVIEKTFFNNVDGDFFGNGSERE